MLARRLPVRSLAGELVVVLKAAKPFDKPLAGAGIARI
jgi:hypothetical protein